MPPTHPQMGKTTRRGAPMSQGRSSSTRPDAARRPMTVTTKNRADEVALFRSGVIGAALTRRDLPCGDLAFDLVSAGQEDLAPAHIAIGHRVLPDPRDPPVAKAAIIQARQRVKCLPISSPRRR